MCGICLQISLTGTITRPEKESPEWLHHRGPDHVGCVEVESDVFQASVLCMRCKLVPQPVSLENELGYLAWNGEVYQRVNEKGLLDDTWGEQIADTELIAEGVQTILQRNQSSNTLEELARFFSDLVNAEYAFCIWTETTVYYGRDPLGRRSLLVNDTEHTWELASVTTRSHNDKWQEVVPGFVYAYCRSGRSTLSVPFVPSASLPLTLSSPPECMEMASDTLHTLLTEAVRRRLPHHPHKVSILFSGGIDSVVLAALTLHIVPNDQPVRLINISFRDDDDKDATTVGEPPKTIAADTKAALDSFQDLKRLFPNHSDLELICQHATWSEIQSVESYVGNLIHPQPSNSVMHLNIATALWFAARASSSRVLLTGLGADEQMGGYGRHRKVWNADGEVALRKELDLDMGRLWERNLGRDDRILADHAQEARFPYLDLHVTSFLRKIGLEHVCDFTLPPGQGDKRILRLLAGKLGLEAASKAVKRAIQFGSRISHVSDKRRYGSKRKATRLK